MSWVFGYGSLMWRPGFNFAERQPALLHGYHRAFCRYSHRHRGTPDKPGLVIGLREGQSCLGTAFRLNPDQEAPALAYLDEREGAGYLRQKHLLTLHRNGNGGAKAGTNDAGPAKAGADNADAGNTAWAWVYVPNTDHPSYFGQADTVHIVNLVRQGRGESGTALDYLRETLAALETLGVEEPKLREVMALVEASP